jgi:hypothetical protein
MAHRKLTDLVGREWDVWEVNPTAIDQGMPDSGVQRRVSERLQKGWLAFQCPHEKRRLSPIPPGWNELTDADLLALLERATKAARPARLIE